MDSSLLLKEIAGFGASLVGFADIREFAPWPRAISIALPLDPVTLKGVRAEAFPATLMAKDLEYESNLRAAFQHKMAATRAGLGFIGKSGLLITLDFGPRIRLVTIFTDLSFPTGQPILEGRCGGCRLCMQACPAGAIRGREWQAGMAREELLDAHACQREAQRLLKERVGADEAVCGVYIAVCPQGEKERSLKNTPKM